MTGSAWSGDGVDTNAPALEAESALKIKSGDLRFRDFSKTAIMQFAFAVAFLTLGVFVLVDAIAAGDLVTAGVSAILGLIALALGLLMLDSIDCRYRENHECRNCRSETARWEANS